MSTNRTDRIRSAIAAGDFLEAERLWLVYAEELKASIAARKCSEAMIEEAGDLVQWARLSVNCFRMHSLTRLYDARAVEVYRKHLLDGD